MTMDNTKMQEILTQLRQTIHSCSESVAQESGVDPVLKGSTVNMMAGMKALLDAYAEGVSKMSTLVVQTDHDDSTLRKLVEEVAAGLEGSIENFRQKLSPRLINRPVGQLPPNVGQVINAVIEYTEQSTMKTIAIMNDLEDIRNKRQEFHEKLRAATLCPDLNSQRASFDTVIGELAALEENYQNLHLKMLENQSFQDLTGQALQLLVWLVNSVESSLRHLAEESGIKVQPKEAQAPTEEKNELPGQADVDALLAGLD